MATFNAPRGTYDILPDSDTGAYFAGGLLIGSTLTDTATTLDRATVPMSSPPEDR